MSIIIHLGLLASVVIATVACLIIKGGRPSRSMKSVAFTTLPLLLVGVICCLLLSGFGFPTVEWIIPMVGLILVGLWCRSDRLFMLARWGMFIAALAMCANFFMAVESGFTAAPKMAQGAAMRLQQGTLKSAATELRQHYPADATLPKGPISDLVPGTKVGQMTLATPIRQWHTPLTRLYRIHREPAVVWYPGGKVSDTAEKLQVKPVGDPDH